GPTGRADRSTRGGDSAAACARGWRRTPERSSCQFPALRAPASDGRTAAASAAAQAPRCAPRRSAGEGAAPALRALRRSPRAPDADTGAAARRGAAAQGEAPALSAETVPQSATRGRAPPGSREALRSGRETRLRGSLLAAA